MGSASSRNQPYPYGYGVQPPGYGMQYQQSQPFVQPQPMMPFPQPQPFPQQHTRQQQQQQGVYPSSTWYVPPQTQRQKKKRSSKRKQAQNVFPEPNNQAYNGFAANPGSRPRPPQTPFNPPQPINPANIPPLPSFSNPTDVLKGYNPEPSPVIDGIPGRPPPPRRTADSPFEATMSAVLAPHTPVHPSAYGPPGGAPHTPIRNQLPAPPRDVYNDSPYKMLLDLPHTKPLLTEMYTRHKDDEKLTNSLLRRKKSRKGLFRAFSSRKAEKADDRKLLYVPVYTQQSKEPYVPPPIPVAGSQTQPQAQPQPQPQPQPASSPPRPPPVRFDQQSPLRGFLNHSNHRIIYRNKIYETATHLHEALKFLDHRPDIAERIRNCPIDEVYPLSSSFQQFQRPDWAEHFLPTMEDVLYCKFKQHPDLRGLLMNTGIADIIYSDVQDDYWGDGAFGRGVNHLGKALVQVRQRLRAEGY